MSWDCKDLKIYFNVNCMQIRRQLRPVEYVGADGLVYSRCEPNGMQLFDCEVCLWINIWQLTSLQRPWNTKMSSVTVLNWIYRKTRSSYPSPNVTRKWWEFCSHFEPQGRLYWFRPMFSFFITKGRFWYVYVHIQTGAYFCLWRKIITEICTINYVNLKFSFYIKRNWFWAQRIL